MPPILRRATLAIACVLFLLHTQKFAGHTTDDAFISFRYAVNLVEGRGLTYNPPARVEGFSNPLWILLLAAGHALGLELELWSKLLGLACGLIALALVDDAAHTVCDRPGSPAWAVAAAWLVSASAFAAWCVGGLETSLYALELLALTLALHRGWSGTAGAIAAAAAATRPEGSVVLALTLAHGFWQRRADGPGAPWLPRFASVAVPLVLAFHAARWWYFGSLVPQSVAAKVAGGAGHATSALGYLYALVMYLPVPVLVLAAAAISFRSGEGPLFTLPPVLALAQGIAVLGVGGDWMPLYRLLVPLLPLAFLLAAAGLETVLGLIAPFLARMDRATAVGGILICALKLAAVPLEESVQLHMQASLGRLQERVGKHLERRSGRVAVGDIGRIGFRSRLPVMDLKGLVSPEAVAAFQAHARAPGVDPGAGWVLDARAEWIAVLVEQRVGGPVGVFPNDQKLLQDPRLREDYALDARFFEAGGPMEYRLFRRKDLAGEPEPGRASILRTPGKHLEHSLDVPVRAGG